MDSLEFISTCFPVFKSDQLITISVLLEGRSEEFF